ncbi:NAD(P)/FAD-dependent oxidoreductase [Pseudomonas sp. PCH199]|uniref:flavin-containing monooxygenase n=1 Tax=unclassified Pseudomonas TaxID=196821 RepID=UPI000BCB3350|nr:MULTISPECIES: NAD(P)/FAD-dependent oxidoreductase [unclassified Pseudomonas]MCW8277806.1 NAD(P)/FAD-dependent oxidoreductase [Pseudomonas sp. PCH199]PAM81967.1 cyclohexanone monooxygenase [Pseudomonas sp. ERMR1:02]
MPHNNQVVSSVNSVVEIDAVVVGAGFAGLYMLHLLRDKLKLNVEVYDSAEGVGGTWYWNRYPGARCDIPSHHYSYSFSAELQQEWTWSEKYAAQPEILSYLNHVAERYDLLKDIQFSTRVVAAHYDATQQRWLIETDSGRRLSAKYFVPAVGTLSSANIPKFKGHGSFEGEVYFTGHWPKEGVDFTGKRVGIIGTGATAMQAIPLIAEQAAHLTVFQRTPNFAAPLVNEPMRRDVDQAAKANYPELRRQAWETFAGVPFDRLKPSALEESEEQRRAHYEACWQDGGFSLWIGSYGDILFNKEANETAAEFVRAKIRERVKDPVIASVLCPPAGQTYGTKRQPCETNYYETFNRQNVSLVDIKKAPIEEITGTGITTAGTQHEFDAIIYATGFDAFTGALFKIDIRGRDGRTLQEYWSQGPRTLVGLAAHGFPNMFTITGPQSPSVLFNMPLGIEMHCEWIADCIEYMELNGFGSIEANRKDEDEWISHVKEVADSTLLPEATSWYSGANIPGKPQVFMVYLGGGKHYKQVITEMADKGYAGFKLEQAAVADSARKVCEAL